jgi:hypothetical protein
MRGLTTPGPGAPEFPGARAHTFLLHRQARKGGPLPTDMASTGIGGQPGRGCDAIRGVDVPVAAGATTRTRQLTRPLTHPLTRPPAGPQTHRGQHVPARRTGLAARVETVHHGQGGASALRRVGQPGSELALPGTTSQPPLEPVHLPRAAKVGDALPVGQEVRPPEVHPEASSGGHVFGFGHVEVPDHEPAPGRPTGDTDPGPVRCHRVQCHRAQCHRAQCHRVQVGPRPDDLQGRAGLGQPQLSVLPAKRRPGVGRGLLPIPGREPRVGATPGTERAERAVLVAQRLPPRPPSMPCPAHNGRGAGQASGSTRDAPTRTRRSASPPGRGPGTPGPSTPCSQPPLRERRLRG